MCDCQAQIDRALATGHDGIAEYLATRCDMRHGEQNVPNEQEEAS